MRGGSALTSSGRGGCALCGVSTRAGTLHGGCGASGVEERPGRGSAPALEPCTGVGGDVDPHLHVGPLGGVCVQRVYKDPPQGFVVLHEPVEVAAPELAVDFDRQLHRGRCDERCEGVDVHFGRDLEWGGRGGLILGRGVARGARREPATCADTHIECAAVVDDDRT